MCQSSQHTHNGPHFLANGNTLRGAWVRLKTSSNNPLVSSRFCQPAFKKSIPASRPPEALCRTCLRCTWDCLCCRPNKPVPGLKMEHGADLQQEPTAWVVYCPLYWQDGPVTWSEASGSAEDRQYPWKKKNPLPKGKAITKASYYIRQAAILAVLLFKALLQHGCNI